MNFISFYCVYIPKLSVSVYYSDVCQSWKNLAKAFLIKQIFFCLKVLHVVYLFT